jgi:hypothetical protein
MSMCARVQTHGDEEEVEDLLVEDIERVDDERKGRVNPKPHGHIAVIGAGLTGVASAANFIDHGFEVTLFEAEEHRLICSMISSRLGNPSFQVMLGWKRYRIELSCNCERRQLHRPRL